MNELKVVNIDMGSTVLCDYCNKDFTDSNNTGGFMFGSYACCPDCEPEKLKLIQGCGEKGRISSKCPPTMSFRDYIYSVRECNE